MTIPNIALVHLITTGAGMVQSLRHTGRAPPYIGVRRDATGAS